MEKIPTLFMRDPADMKHVTPDINPLCQWVIDGEGTPTRKYDGTCVMFDGENWFARREVKAGKKTPDDYVPISTDPNTGKTMGWEPIGQSAFAKYHAEALENEKEEAVLLLAWPVGTYELIGPKVQGDPEGVGKHLLIRHATADIVTAPNTFDDLKEFMSYMVYEGVVWHHEDGRMAKLKRRDFPTPSNK